jgi:hypothetical protein
MTAFIVHKDSIDLIVTAVIIAGLHGDRDIPSEASKKVIAHADDMGEILWRANVAAVNNLYGTDEISPPYEWRPILELMGLDLTPDQLIQIERTRRALEQQSSDHPDWPTSPAKRLLEALGGAVSKALTGWPRLPLASNSRETDYAGIAQATDAWSRNQGFRMLTRPAGQAQN